MAIGAVVALLGGILAVVAWGGWQSRAAARASRELVAEIRGERTRRERARERRAEGRVTLH